MIADKALDLLKSGPKIVLTGQKKVKSLQNINFAGFFLV